MEFKDRKEKEAFVHSVFSSIAYRYDLLNTVLSFNQDRYWRRFAVRKCNLKPGDKALDVACGTGKLSLELAKVVGSNGQVVGIDFCEEMLNIANSNISKTPFKEVIKFIHGNAMDLPFPENTFDCATIAFALRNVSDVQQTISEMTRVVKRGGRVVNLELSKPTMPVFKQLYALYFNGLVPVMGRLGVGKKGPYSWLPESLKSFYSPDQITGIYRECGLTEVCCYPLTGGIVTVHVGTKK
ncbi:MAG: demethylmenaquinone methyltransferase [Peptococcaceae bacterium]|nr:demethylmenaquinone methyltransferase [Peptococcaceae bacterium]